MSRTVNDFLSIAIAAVFVLLFARLLPVQDTLPSGVFLPATNHAVQPSAKPVYLYAASSSPSASDKVLGRITLQMHSEHPTSVGKEKVLRYARHLAREAGANAIRVKQFFHTIPGTVSPKEYSYVFSGFAILTDKPQP